MPSRIQSQAHIFHQIHRAFDAAGKADERIAHAYREALFAWDAFVGHSGRMAKQAFHPAEAFCKFEQSGAGGERPPHTRPPERIERTDP